ncbi:glycosyl transferase WecB/TagA/CpsF [Leptolyngbya sp. NIES-3755]|nr:glycosyl transferase WecB/TagA/CpsF [Leptolyngbya sp. NIES-3755]
MFSPCFILGARVHALTMNDLNDLIAQSIKARQRWIIAHHNLHSLYLIQRDRKMRQFYRSATYTHIDGMAVVLLGRLLKFPLQRSHRTTYADWLPVLMQKCMQHQWNVFYLGSKPGIAERGCQVLRQQFPGLRISAIDGYFDARSDSSDNREIIAKINAHQPDILMVGMGMPRQEHWIIDNVEQLNVRTILPCGAAIDYIAGAIPVPPRWAGQCGLEWLFRLIAEPKRLWRRYLVEPLFLGKLIVAQQFNRQISYQEDLD